MTPELPLRPQLPELSARAREITNCARRLLEAHGWEYVTMRVLAAELGIKAPSLYKHFRGREALRAALISDGLAETGQRLFAAIAEEHSIAALLQAYRQLARDSPSMYRLATSGEMPRADLPDGLEEWAGSPFFLVTGDPYDAQALWSFAHGMSILEIDNRYPPGSELDRTWERGIRAFTNSLRTE
ncbi:TetR/AcrR family transcriptional regulator [Hoyosella altamirensis]|uniref:AcrR family transcriptional regulator n=1 Tax=Hoyosella altamirensis TaxID=616997 RepID=A0A839RP36_9ACTN|nr:TetR/AcrR family transcriptional regulator [Hoyosella altamirensis]MBB3037958.1 AcrR family transcriptional regulator [Hoyosella altamirensis]